MSGEQPKPMVAAHSTRWVPPPEHQKTWWSGAVALPVSYPAGLRTRRRHHARRLATSARAHALVNGHRNAYTPSRDRGNKIRPGCVPLRCRSVIHLSAKFQSVVPLASSKCSYGVRPVRIRHPRASPIGFSFFFVFLFFSVFFLILSFFNQSSVADCARCIAHRLMMLLFAARLVAHRP